MQHLPYQFGRYWIFLCFQPCWEIWHSKTLLRNSPSTHLYPHVSHLLTKSLLLPCLVFGRWFMWFASNLRVKVENVWSLITECLWRAHSTCRSGGARAWIKTPCRWWWENIDVIGVCNLDPLGLYLSNVFSVWMTHLGVQDGALKTYQYSQPLQKPTPSGSVNISRQIWMCLNQPRQKKTIISFYHPS